MKALAWPLLACALAAGAAAQAAQYKNLDAAASQVRFTSRQMGVPVEGRFRKIESSLAVDPQAPQAASGQVRIDLASIDTGLKEANDEVMGPSWFDVAQHPTATFELKKIDPVGDGRFRAGGVLSIRGVSRNVAFDARLQSDSERVQLEGSLPIKRLDFGVGQGGWGSVDVVADEVIVSFKLVLKP